jgi:transcriptional regulator with XRE-family HTH domain
MSRVGPHTVASVTSSPQRDFGARLRELRIRNHLSQQVLAARAGFSQRKLSDIETGRRAAALDPTQYQRLTEALGVTLSELFGHPDEPSPPAASAARLAELNRIAGALSDEDVALLTTVAREIATARASAPAGPSEGTPSGLPGRGDEEQDDA